MPLDYLVSALVTLLVVVDPVGLAPTFLAVTHGLPAQTRKRSRWRACLIAGAILFGTALVGDWLLRQLGIGVPAFRIAGGLLLFLVATEMVLGVRNNRQIQAGRGGDGGARPQHRGVPARHPADGGARRHHRDAAARRPGRTAAAAPGVLFGVIVVVMAACLVAFLLANRIERLLGRHRQCRAVAPARRDPRRAGGAVRDRRGAIDAAG